MISPSTNERSQHGGSSHKEYLENVSCFKITRAGKDYMFGENISNSSILRGIVFDTEHSLFYINNRELE